LTKRLVERAMDVELTEHLGYEHGQSSLGGAGNTRNGSTPRTLMTEHGPVRIDTPRDRNSSPELQVVRKRQRRVEGFDEKIIALYARGMSVRDIIVASRRSDPPDAGHRRPGTPRRRRATVRGDPRGRVRPGQPRTRESGSTGMAGARIPRGLDIVKAVRGTVSGVSPGGSYATPTAQLRKQRECAPASRAGFPLCDIWELNACCMSRSADWLRSSREWPRAARPRHEETTMAKYLLHDESMPQELAGGRS
jgi:hypothetical protein